MMTISDIFDALTATDRPYKKAWTVEEALAELDNSAGKHFDPHLVEKFKGIVDEVKKIKSKYMDSPDQFKDLETFIANSK